MRWNMCIIRISPNRMPIPSCWPVLLTVRNGRVFWGGAVGCFFCELVQLCFTLLVGDHWSALYLFKSRPKTLQVRDWFIGYDWLIATLQFGIRPEIWSMRIGFLGFQPDLVFQSYSAKHDLQDAIQLSIATYFCTQWSIELVYINTLGQNMFLLYNTSYFPN